MFDLLPILQWPAVVLSLVGACLTAGGTNRYRRWGFGVWLGSNALLIAAATIKADWPILVQFSIFMVTSGIGMWNNWKD